LPTLLTPAAYPSPTLLANAVAYLDLAAAFVSLNAPRAAFFNKLHLTYGFCFPNSPGLNP